MKTSFKSYSFLNLFDWNKSQRRSCNEGCLSQENMVNAEVGNVMQTSNSRTVFDNDTSSVSSLMGSSGHSRSPSTIGDDVYEKRAAGIVARLMGLDTLPVVAPSASNMHSSPGVSPDHTNLVNKSPLSCPDNSMELRPSKIRNRGIERFQMDVLPRRLVKTSSLVREKQLPHIISPRNLSSKDADLKSAQALHSNDLRELPKTLESRKTREAPWKLELASSRGISTTKLQWRSEKNSNLKDGVESSDVNSIAEACSTGKGQAASASKRRSHMNSMENGVKYAVRVTPCKDLDKCLRNEPVKNQMCDQKSRGKNGPTATASGRLVQNNMKNNMGASKLKSSLRLAIVSQQQENIQYAQNAMIKKGNICAMGTKLGNRMESGRRTNLLVDKTPELESTVQARTPLRTNLQTGLPSGSITANKDRTRVRHNVVIDGRSDWSRSSRQLNNEVVSFTFSAPIDKSKSRSGFGNHKMKTETSDNENSQLYTMKTEACSLNTKFSADGNNLGILIEQKLRELSSRMRPSYGSHGSGDGCDITSTSIPLEDSASACETMSHASAENDCEPSKPCKCEDSIYGMILSVQNQAIHNRECADNIDDTNQSKYCFSSDRSVPDTSLSTESCGSAEGERLCSSMEITGELDPIHIHEFLEVVAQSKFFDTASSISDTAAAELPDSDPIRTYSYEHPLEFIREILSGVYSNYPENQGEFKFIDPRSYANLLEQLSSNSIGQERTTGLMYLDCAIDFLNLKCGYYFCKGYNMWLKGVAFLGKLSAEAVYKDLTGYSVVDEWMVDGLVEREMSTALGKWIDFEAELFEAGGQIEGELMSRLIEEIVDDFL